MDLVKKSENRVLHNKESFIIFGLVLLIWSVFVTATLTYRNSVWQWEIFNTRCINSDDMFYNGAECVQEKFKMLEIFGITFMNFLTVLILFGLFFLMSRLIPSANVVIISIIVIMFYVGCEVGSIYVFYEKSTTLIEFGLTMSEVPFAFVVISIAFNIGVIIVCLAKYRLTGFLLQQTTKLIFSKPFRKLWILPIMGLFSVFPILCVGTFTTFGMVSQLNYKPFSVEFIVMIISIILNVFVTLWVVDIIATVFYITIYGAVASWYFNRFNNDFPLGRALKNTLKYHVGSIIFGTFCIDLILLVFQVTIMYRLSAEMSGILLVFFLGNLMQIILIVPRYTFVEIAIHGSSYCEAFKNIATLFSSNKFIFVSVTVLLDITSYFLVYGSLWLTALVTYGLSLSNDETWKLIFLFSALSAIVVFATIFIFICRPTLECLFLCFCKHDRMDRRYKNIEELGKFNDLAGSIK